MGRVDDVIDVAGHLLSTGEMEEAVSTHKDVAECAVIGVHDNMKGQIPLGLVVLKAGVDRTKEEVMKELAQMVRNTIGPIACYKETGIVKRLPKTRSGKIRRATMRKIVDGEQYSIPSTIDDPTTLGRSKRCLKRGRIQTEKINTFNKTISRIQDMHDVFAVCKMGGNEAVLTMN